MVKQLRLLLRLQLRFSILAGPRVPMPVLPGPTMPTGSKKDALAVPGALERS